MNADDEKILDLVRASIFNRLDKGDRCFVLGITNGKFCPKCNFYMGSICVMFCILDEKVESPEISVSAIINGILNSTEKKIDPVFTFNGELNEEDRKLTWEHIKAVRKQLPDKYKQKSVKTAHKSEPKKSTRFSDLDI